MHRLVILQISSVTLTYLFSEQTLYPHILESSHHWCLRGSDRLRSIFRFSVLVIYRFLSFRMRDVQELQGTIADNQYAEPAPDQSTSQAALRNYYYWIYNITSTDDEYSTNHVSKDKIWSLPKHN